MNKHLARILVALTAVSMTMAQPIASLAATENEASVAAVESEAAEGTEDTSKDEDAEALYEKLMAVETLTDLNALLEGLSDSERACIENDFSDEQKTAYASLKESLENAEKSVGEDSGTEDTQSGSEEGSSKTSQSAAKKVKTSKKAKSSADQSTSLTEDAAVSAAAYGWQDWGSSSNGNTFTVTPTLDGVDAVYYTFHNASDVGDAQTATSGQAIVVENFNSSSSAGYILFFVKPQSNYLLLGAGADGNGDIYSVDGSYPNISSYPGIKNLVASAKSAGYIGLLGYMRAANDRNNMNVKFQLVAESPDITVSAVADKTTGVKPGDELEFTITVTPGKTQKGTSTIDEVKATEIKINGTSVTFDQLVDQGDGTYVTKVKHVVTQEEYASGNVELSVTAQTKYSAQTKSSSQTSDYLKSTATIEKNASTTCAIANQSRLYYELTDPKGAEGLTELPNFPTVPAAVEDKYEGDTVAVDTDYSKNSPLTDTVNGGVWTFSGWYTEDGELAPASVKLGKTPTKLTGYWTFEKKYVQLTVSKKVTGELGDKSKAFSFKVSGDGIAEADQSFCLKDGESKTITVQIGSSVAISETNAEEYDTTYAVSTSQTQSNAGAAESAADTESKTGDSGEGKTATITIGSSDMSVVFTNDKTCIPDTGVTVDTLPYLFMLAIAAAGVIAFAVKKRSIRRD